jgi:hypothetical protein
MVSNRFKVINIEQKKAPKVLWALFYIVIVTLLNK